ncbi:MAG TPA: FAD-linked oxidase C-terminal domain-containing protein [Pseudolysinimonas sp.]|nr:FAD-linked oxidase C-terminal domain-containing protein [Pseudolysinimonas sp.]
MSDITFSPRLSEDVTRLAEVRSDRSGWLPEGEPRGVIRVTEAGEISEVLRWASTAGVPVVTRGAGSGLAGGATAGSDAVVLDLGGLDRILEIDPVNQIAVVEPGVITADLDRAAAAHGLRYAPDPGSVEISTIGGNIATNAGGLRGAKYGVTRDAVLGLDVVLADGSTLSTGGRTLKGVAGYDLTSLFVGSEGTLGVIAQATLRLRPIPVRTATLSAFFASVGDAAEAVNALIAARIEPSTLELIDGATLAAIDAAEGTDFRTRGAAFVLIQTDGYGAAEELDAAIAILAPHALVLERTDDPGEAERLTRARRLALPSVERLGRVLIEDIAVPRSRLADAIERIGEIARRRQTRIFVFAHAGDGNLHPIILLEDGTIDDTATAAAGDIFALALELGGTLTGEHGIGVLKRAWIRDELGETSHDLHLAIKSLLDPHNILNPGKAI